MNYHWQRFWIPRSVTQADSFYSPTGYNAGEPFAHKARLESLADIPCLVSLGEPGIGKTRALKDAQAYTQGLNRETLWFELGGYQSDELLCENLFGDSTFQDWLHGTHHLYLFLDSFDEGRLTIRVLAALLARELKKYRNHLHRLSLRITCRSAEQHPLWSILHRSSASQCSWMNANVGTLPPGGEGSTLGERTDIHVDAFVQRPGQQEADHIIVIIEVKGCWHWALTTAMETQLVQRYMRDNPAAYGLYLVGWFYCDQWKKKKPSYSMHDLQKQLDTQATALSRSGRRVRALVMNTSLRSKEKKYEKDF